MYELSISLNGERIEAKAFLGAVSTFLRLLDCVDAQKAVRWRLATLRYNSPATIGFVGEPRKKRGPDDAQEVGRTLVSGLASLSKGQRPTTFDDIALELAKGLAELKGHGGIDSLLLIDQNGAAPTTLPISPRIAASVDEFIGARYESLGMVEGRLELVSSHGGVMRCNVYEKLLGKPVKCFVPNEMRATVLESFDQDVVAHGIVKRDASGQARQIALHHLDRVTKVSNPPRSLAGLAPDFTDGVDSADYIKGRWK